MKYMVNAIFKVDGSVRVKKTAVTVCTAGTRLLWLPVISSPWVSLGFNNLGLINVTEHDPVIE